MKTVSYLELINPTYRRLLFSRLYVCCHWTTGVVITVALVTLIAFYCPTLGATRVLVERVVCSCCFVALLLVAASSALLLFSSDCWRFEDITTGVTIMPVGNNCDSPEWYKTTVYRAPKFYVMINKCGIARQRNAIGNCEKVLLAKPGKC